MPHPKREDFRFRKPHKDSCSIWEYFSFGKDLWGRTVYAAFFLGRFAGYRYRLTNKEMEKRRGGIKQLGIRRWQECPDWCVARQKNPAFGEKTKGENLIEDLS